MGGATSRKVAIEEALLRHTAKCAPHQARIEHHAGHIMAGFVLAKDETRPRNRLAGRKTTEAQLKKIQRQAGLALKTLEELNEPAWQALLRSEQVPSGEHEEGEAYMRRLARELRVLTERAQRAANLIETPTEARRNPGNPIAEVVAFRVHDALEDLTGKPPARSIKKTDPGRRDGKLIHAPSGHFIRCLTDVFAALGIKSGPDAPAKKAIAGHKSIENSD